MSIRIEDLAKTDFRSVTVAGGKRIAPTSPGEMLREEFLKPMGLTNYRLAKEIDVPAQRIGDIIAGKRDTRWKRTAAVSLLWTHRRLVAAASGRLRHAPRTGSACRKAREDQALIGAPGGESIMSTAADTRIAEVSVS